MRNASKCTSVTVLQIVSSERLPHFATGARKFVCIEYYFKTLTILSRSALPSGFVAKAAALLSYTISNP